MVVKYEGDAKYVQPICNNLLLELQKDIMLGKLKGGEKLTEQRICEEYGVSRTPVREAIKQLEIEGLVQTIPNRGAFVSGFTEQDIFDIFELREAYEILAVGWAIERMTDEEFENIQETFEFMEFYTMKKDVAKMLNINTKFHQQIYNASHNKMISKMLSSYQVYIKNSTSYKSYGEKYLETVFNEHKAIFDAIAARDADAGRAAMKEHMDKSIERRKQHQKEMGSI